MDIDAVTKLIQAVKASDISVLEVSEGDTRVRIERGLAMPPAAAQFPTAVYSAQEAAPAQEQDDSGGAEPYKRVTSPLVGIFRAQAPEKGVDIGAQLKKGAVVCFVEAMKLMNEIVMPEDGALVWLAAADGDAVEYGQTLFHYR